MALINCPSCGKKISNKSTFCPHCHFVLSSENLEQNQEQMRKAKRKRRRSIEKQSFLALLVFLLGAVGTYMSQNQIFSNTDINDMAQLLSPYLLSIGIIWYGVNRVRIFIGKRR